ncbi:MAG: hypothetical protein IJP54_07300, partial [Synergistaceae bacterium]|nr:hypothetical protein [Synergistaceae bacterium]
MRKVMKKTGRISVSARCSSLALAVLLALSSPSYALSVSGIPDWLEGAVSRSLNAVWQEIPDSPEIDRYATLELVAARLFAGYGVKVKPMRGEPAIFFSVREKILRPDVRIIMPDLRGMSGVWFEQDTAGMSQDVAGLLEDVPQSALTWADEALRERIREFVRERLPGWEFSQQIYISQESTLVTLTFRPSAKMVLAVKPAIYSRTIPAMFRSDMEAKLIPEFSPLIGIPVKWAEKHRQDIEKHAREFLEDRNTVDNLRADVSIKFRADTVSDIEANADSKDFMFQMWVAAYAGIEGRYPEAGVFFGFRPDVNAPEIYTELIFSLDDFGVVSRIGGRYNVAGNFFAGIEMQWPESEYFLRLQYIPMK